MQRMTARILPLVAILAAAPRASTQTTTAADSSCYAIITIVIADSATKHIDRVLTSGIRRFKNAGKGGESDCMPAERQRFRTMQQTVDARADSVGLKTTQIRERFAFRGTSARLMADHLVRLGSAGRFGSAYNGIE